MANYLDKREILLEVLDHQMKIYDENFSREDDNTNVIGDKVLDFFQKYDIDRKYVAYLMVPKEKKKVHGVEYMSNKLAKMLMSIPQNLSNRYSFRNQPYREDMIMSVTIILMKTVKNFDLNYFIEKDKAPNAYGYYTQICEKACAKFCDEQNEKLSKHLDYLLDNVFTDFRPDEQEREVFDEKATYYQDLRGGFSGKWSIEEMQKRKKEQKDKKKHKKVVNLKGIL